jgi:predicted secreted protein
MATHAGSEGIVKVGSNTVAEVRSYSIEESADTLEQTTMGQSARQYRPSLTTWSGSVDVYWDETDTTGQGALTVGSEITLNVYPEGDASGDTYYTGSCIVTGVSKSGAFDGMVEASISVQGDGALTTTTV